MHVFWTRRSSSPAVGARPLQRPPLPALWTMNQPECRAPTATLSTVLAAPCPPSTRLPRRSSTFTLNPVAHASRSFSDNLPKNTLATKSVVINGEPIALQIRRSKKARRYILTVRSDRTIVITVPIFGSITEAIQFAQSRTRWLVQALSRIQSKSPPFVWQIGTEIWFRGERVKIESAESPSPGMAAVRVGSETILIPNSDENLRPALEKVLREISSRELVQRVTELARTHHCTVSRVRIGNQRSRWGSCSHRGTVSLNWRLIQVPADVRDYIILHELMHMREMNHSAQFWAQVARACPNYQECEAWLKANPVLM